MRLADIVVATVFVAMVVAVAAMALGIMAAAVGYGLEVGRGWAE